MQDSFIKKLIDRPVLSLVINFVIILTGLVSLKQLTTREYPKITYPVISIKTQYPGASTAIIESQILIPQEEAFASIPDLDYMQSSVNNEECTLVLHFEQNKDIDKAIIDIMERMAHVKQQMPQSLRDPTISKSQSSSNVLIRLCAFSETSSLADVADYLHRNIKSQLETVNGVGSVHISGGGGGVDSGAFQIHATLEPEKLAQYDLTIRDIQNSIQSFCVRSPLGNSIENERIYSIILDNSAKGIEDYKKIPVKATKSGVITLQDVAKLETIKDDLDTFITNNNNKVVMVAIIARQDANPAEVAKKVKQKLAQLTKNIPNDIKISIFEDNSEGIEKSINAVYQSILEAIIFVFLVLLFFLKSFRATLIPLVTIPISLLGGCLVLFLCGFSINILTLLSMVLGVGLVVDDAIVVLENIYKYIEKGDSIYEASVKGASEIQFAIIAMTFTLLAVFLPIAFIPGIIGKLFIEFAVTLTSVVLVSGIVALTLTPMMCSKILKSNQLHLNIAWIDKTLEYIENLYKKSLMFVLEIYQAVLFFAISFAFLGLYVSENMTKRLSPETDQSMLIFDLEAPNGSTAEYVNKYAQKIEKIFKEIPEIENHLVSLHTAQRSNIYVKLKSPEKRKKSAKALLEEINKKIENLQSGLYVRGYCLQNNILNSEDDNNRVNIMFLSSKSYDEMEKVINPIIQKIMKNFKEKFIQEKTLSSSIRPEKSYLVKINEQKAAQMYVTVHDIATSLSMIMRGQPPTDRFEVEGKKYPMRLMVSKKFKENVVENFKKFHVRAFVGERGENAKLVPLYDLLEIKEVQTRPQAFRYEGMRSIFYGFELKPNASAFETYQEISQMLDKELPTGYKHSPSGMLRKMQKEDSNIFLLFLLALLFIFLIMAAQFESFIDPFIIMFAVPLALAGGVITLSIISGSLSIFTYIALITLIGLISKHGILIVEFANHLLLKHNAKTAIIEASILRLRPILMTTLAMVLGAFPLAISKGAGSETRSQIGWTILGGLSFGTLFTIFVIPCIYLIIKQRNTKNKL